MVAAFALLLWGISVWIGMLHYDFRHTNPSLTFAALVFGAVPAGVLMLWGGKRLVALGMRPEATGPRPRSVYSRKDFASDLRRLSALPLDTDENATKWYFAAGVVVRNLMRSRDIAVPEIVWHWISDADIRRRDARFAEEQNRQLAEFLEQLEK